MDLDNNEHYMLYIKKFNKYKKKLHKLQNELTYKQKMELYNNGDKYGKHIFNNYIDLEFGLIEFDLGL